MSKLTTKYWTLTVPQGWDAKQAREKTILKAAAPSNAELVIEGAEAERLVNHDTLKRFAARHTNAGWTLTAVSIGEWSGIVVELPHSVEWFLSCGRLILLGRLRESGDRRLGEDILRHIKPTVGVRAPRS